MVGQARLGSASRRWLSLISIACRRSPSVTRGSWARPRGRSFRWPGWSTTCSRRSWLDIATASPVAIEYDLNGKWVGATAAAQSEESSKVWQRVRVRYDNGLLITANQAEEPLRVGEHLLGQYGWTAEGAGVTAWTAVRDNVVADYAETADSVFANARSARDWNLSGIIRIHPRVDRFELLGPRSFRVTYAWRVNESLPRDYSCFVHFGKEGCAGVRDPLSAGPRAGRANFALETRTKCCRRST